jgi:hypothetical protein
MTNTIVNHSSKTHCLHLVDHGYWREWKAYDNGYVIPSRPWYLDLLNMWCDIF